MNIHMEKKSACRVNIKKSWTRAVGVVLLVVGFIFVTIYLGSPGQAWEDWKYTFWNI